MKFSDVSFISQHFLNFPRISIIIIIIKNLQSYLLTVILVHLRHAVKHSLSTKNCMVYIYIYVCLPVGVYLTLIVETHFFFFFSYNF